MADEKKETTPKRKKMNALTLAEIEAALLECKEKQGGLVSKYARQLLARKKALSG
jgi:predicted outer membrane protein